jgi:hypothetical protein
LSQADKDKQNLVTEDDVRCVLFSGPLSKGKAARALRELTNCGRTLSYDVFTQKGKFKNLLNFDHKNGTVALR